MTTTLEVNHMPSLSTPQRIAACSISKGTLVHSDGRVLHGVNVCVEGDAGRFADFFSVPWNGLDWCVDVLVAYFDWHYSEAFNFVLPIAREADPENFGGG